MEQRDYHTESRRNTLRDIIIKLTNTRDKEKILKRSEGKVTNNIQRNPHKVIS